MIAGEGKAAQTAFERAKDGTLYWTLSIYFEANAVEACAKKRLSSDDFRKAQLQHPPSLALRNAIDPLFNDIADRDRLGQVEDFLFAAEASEVTFYVPEQVSWSTEGETFVCHLATAAEFENGKARPAKLRRFWFGHSNGALSYHLSFSYHFGQQRDAVTYYFISLLQKLAVPKEFNLGDVRLAAIVQGKAAKKQAGGEGTYTVFDEKLGIDPLDAEIVSPANSEKERQRFWPFVRGLFTKDCASLFRNVFKTEPASIDDLMTSTLVKLIEVPGLQVPRSRSLFFIQDEHFFQRLLPRDDEGHFIPRKRCVQDACYAPYREAITRARSKDADSPHVIRIGDPADPQLPHLGWQWLRQRPDYLELLARKEPGTGRSFFSKDRAGSKPISTLGELKAAMRTGDCWQQLNEVPTEKGTFPCLERPLRFHIPCFEERRTDCLDYLFLAGFNQNIIDWLNQEPSEILDSTDPIYPKEQSQFDESFFVRFANHRAMITYVPRSRTLEVGSNYIGTCPYAFLIHVLALHNEFLAREHELKMATRVKEIQDHVAKEQVDFEKLETAINKLRSSNYEDFERHRYPNIFRYDTERVVFADLEQLRGMARRDGALKDVLRSLEDTLGDLERRQEEKRTKNLGAIATAIGITSGLALFFNVADFVENLGTGATPWAFYLRLGATVLALLGALWVLFIIMRWAWHKLPPA